MPRTLEDYHQEIEQIMAEGDALVAARDPATIDLAKRQITESMLVIAAYQGFVHRDVFAPMLDGADAATRSRVNELKIECIALTEDLRFNIRDFVGLMETASLDWDVVAPKMTWLSGRARAHVAHVRTALAPDLSDADHARLRAYRTGLVGVQAA